MRVDIVKPAHPTPEERRLDALWTDAEKALHDYVVPTDDPPDNPTTSHEAPWSQEDLVRFIMDYPGAPLPLLAKEFVLAHPNLVRKGRLRLTVPGTDKNIRKTIPKDWVQ